ncbi:4Fe-4S binding protein [Crateriforma conspicua]|uniref:Putative electron transport protein YccM n=1 Tax=Crateriforma conspicua TaxID=2527996 RepID=A0A5C5Y440_9PLAN|nr:4Fe-4S binding protein [Crateriforma conspicua]TWT70020.1 putative electron transport protein YccM [Crateriforma conspicua]
MTAGKKRLLALGIAMVCTAALAAGAGQWHWTFGTLRLDPMVLAASIVGLAASALILLSSFRSDDGSNALIRLDWFLPMLRRPKAGKAVSPSILGRTMRRVMPSTLQSDWSTKRRGPVRRWLRRLGPSWTAAPVRRLVQGTCLVTFWILFFYVCWPYDARPALVQPASTGWLLQTVDQQSGEVRFQGDDSTDASIEAGDYFVIDTGVTDDAAADLGQFRIDMNSDGTISLKPSQTKAAGQWDAFFFGTGPYDLYAMRPGQWPSHYADNLRGKERLPAELFLIIDPLVSLSTAVASRSLVWSLTAAGVILIVCVLIPRGFCGYLCPLGTTIDLFDWLVAGRVGRFRVPDGGWWVHIKYYLLAGTMIAAVGGVLISGFFSAIPVVTRGMLFLLDPVQTGATRGWHLIPPINAGHIVSLLLFAAVLCLGFLRPRFWCKYVCPSGAVFSVGNLLRATERKVESSCIHCNKCVEICPFDAIKPDFTTRGTDCTMCQSCGGVCPTHAIKFVERTNLVQLKTFDDPPTGESSLGRRGFLSAVGGSAAAVVGSVGAVAATKAFGAKLSDDESFRPVRPPGSVPEQEFLQMCIRCGECFKACPNNVLQPEGFQQGLEGLWTPMVQADWAGCESSCNACGQVCPTGAIRTLPIEEKRHARMGLAILNESTCLPLAGKEDCDLCVQECQAAGYHAIEYTQVGVQTDESGMPIEGTGFLAPLVIDDACVGCGLCQTRCYAINVKDRGVLDESAIVVFAGGDREDRLMKGSYRELHEQRTGGAAKDPTPTGHGKRSQTAAPKGGGAPGTARSDSQDPFGLGGDADPFGLGDSVGSESTTPDAHPATDTDDLDPFGIGIETDAGQTPSDDDSPF